MQDRYKIKKREIQKPGWILTETVDDNPFQNLPQINNELRPDMNPNQIPDDTGLRAQLASQSTNVKNPDSFDQKSQLRKNILAFQKRWPAKNHQIFARLTRKRPQEKNCVA